MVIRAENLISDSPAYNILKSKIKNALEQYAYNSTDVLNNQTMNYGFNDNCYKSAISTTLDGLKHINHVFNDRKSRSSPFIVGLIGNSLAAGCCDGMRGGFGTGVELFMREYFEGKKEIIFRNLAYGGKSPEFSYWCSGLSGDEDLIVYQTIRIFDLRYTEAFLYNYLSHHHHLKKFSYPAIIIIYSSFKSREDTNYNILVNSYPVPIIDMLRSFQSINNTCSKYFPNYNKTILYYDNIHPNLNGHVLMAMMINRVIQSAVSLPSTLTHKTRFADYHPLPRHFKPNISEVLNFTNRKCFHMLDDVKNGPTVIRNHAFILGEGNQHGSYTKFKRRWESSEINATITFLLPPCQSVYVVWYQRYNNTMGIASVHIDNKYICELDGWFVGYGWDRTRGHDGELVVATDLDSTKPHEITFTILDLSTRERYKHSRGSNFQIIALAVASGENHYHRYDESNED
eukprot:gene3902-7784_t